MKERRLEIRLSEEDFDQIENNAKACGMTLSAYLRNVGCNMMVVQLDYTWVNNYMEEITTFQNVILQMVYTINKWGSYVPTELEFILEKTRTILKYEIEFANEYCTWFKKIEEEARREVRSVAEKRVKQK